MRFFPFSFSFPAARPPSRWLWAAFGYVLLAIALALALALQAPWLGLQLAPQGDGVRVQASAGPAAAVPAGALLLSLRATAGGAAVPLQAGDLIEEPDVLSSYAHIAAFFARQQQIAEVLAQPQVTLHWQDAQGQGETVLTPAQRPLRALALLFWFQLAVSVTG